jgi:hypothetical protein
VEKPENPDRATFPVGLFILVVLVIAAVSGYATLQVLGRDSSDACDVALGRVRIHMASNAVPSAMDEQGWNDVTTMYTAVYTSCPDAAATDFRVNEFERWAAPALEAGIGPAAPIEPVGEPGADPGDDPSGEPGGDSPTGDSPAD